jgi:hypothetical protein
MNNLLDFKRLAPDGEQCLESEQLVVHSAAAALPAAAAVSVSSNPFVVEPRPTAPPRGQTLWRRETRDAILAAEPMLSEHALQARLTKLWKEMNVSTSDREHCCSSIQQCDSPDSLCCLYDVFFPFPRVKHGVPGWKRDWN